MGRVTAAHRRNATVEEPDRWAANAERPVTSEPASAPLSATPESKLAAAGRELAKYVESQPLTEYIDHLLTGYSDKAVAATTVEVDLYARAVNDRAKERARLATAEMVLEQHVKDAVGELRSRANEDTKVFSDWVKRIGFVFLGLAIQQVNTIAHANPIAFGSVVWLLVHAILAVLLIAGGLLLDKPMNWVQRNWTRRQV
jgi:hypothetical protein